MVAALHDDAFVEDEDLIRPDDRRQTVRDDQGRAAAAHPLESILDLLLGE
jgi:hypothetical protein